MWTLPFSSSCCVDFTQSLKLSVFAAGEQKLYKSLALLPSTADRLALQPPRPHGITNLMMFTIMEKGKAMDSLGRQRLPSLYHRGILSHREGTESQFGKIMTKVWHNLLDTHIP